jgi:hypothetical protein
MLDICGYPLDVINFDKYDHLILDVRDVLSPWYRFVYLWGSGS